MEANDSSVNEWELTYENILDDSGHLEYPSNYSIDYALNATFNVTENLTYSASADDFDSLPDTSKVYWALLLLPLPLVAVFGNILVILSVYKERSLQTVTNYFIVSLAFADLLVAAVVMPFAVYVLVNVDWELSDALCDFYIALDVTCSTASIFNLVAISIDRFIAVTQPIKYSKHRNNKRVFLTIAVLWLLSAAIGSPIMLGLNTSHERIPQLCVFYNSDFIIYSSLSSFYIPCLVMIVLYYRIFKAIHERAKKSSKRAADISKTSSSGKLIDRSQPRFSGEGSKRTGHSEGTHLQVIVETDAVTTNTGSGSQPDEDEDDDTAGEDQTTVGHGENRNQSKSQNMNSCRESASALLASAVIAETIRIEIPINGNTDSGYGPSNVEQETQFFLPNTDVRTDSARLHQVASKSTGVPLGKRNGVSKTSEKLQNSKNLHSAKKKPRFNLGRRHKSSRKKREKASAKKERKATKTLAIVLGMFLACWVPFFTCNILDAICIKLQNDRWRPGMSAFLITTWLGYVNSCVNPVIYTIFNMEFRKAFKKLLQDSCKCGSGINR